MESPAVTVVTPTGELDITDRDDLEKMILAAVHRTGTDRVVVDLGAVTFIDSEALASVIIGYNAAVAAGLEFRLTNARGTVRRVLDIAGLTELLGEQS